MDLEALSLAQLEVLSRKVHNELSARYALRVDTMPEPNDLVGTQAVLNYRHKHGCPILLAKMVVEHWRVIKGR